jgi:glutamate dehydrogenase
VSRRCCPGSSRCSAARSATRCAGTPTTCTDWATRILYGFGLLDIVTLAENAGRDVAGADVAARQDLETVASIYFVVSERFLIDDLLSRISRLPRNDRWETLARMALRYDLYNALAALTADVLGSTSSGQPAEERVTEWEHANAAAISRARNAMGDVEDGRSDLAVLSVLLRQIRTLVRTPST